MAERFTRRWLVLRGDRIVATLAGDHPRVAAVGSAAGMLVGADEQGRTVGTGYATDPTNGRPDLADSILVLRHDPRKPQPDILARLAPDAVVARVERAARPAAQGTPAPGPRTYSVGLGARATDQVAMFGDGWVAIARQQPYRVEWCVRESTGCVPGPVLAPSRSLTDADKRAYLARSQRLGLWPPTTRIEETSGWGELFPPFEMPASRLDAGALFPAPDGRLLIHRLPEGPELRTRYDIVDRRGSLSGRLELPTQQQVVGFGSGTIYVVTIDADGLQRVSQHPWP
jgi:hypothetical protein